MKKILASLILLCFLASNALATTHVWRNGVFRNIAVKPPAASYATITYDTGATGILSGSTISYSLTVGNNTNRVLIVAVGIESNSNNDSSVSGITYNGVALSRIHTLEYNPNGGASTYDWGELWYLLAPATGANTLTVSFNNTPAGAGACAMSLYGVAQSAPEASAYNSILHGNAGSSLTTSLTTLTNNAWLVSSYFSLAGATDMSVSTGDTERLRASNLQDGEIATRLISSAGSASFTSSRNSTDAIGHIIASFAPAVQ